MQLISLLSIALAGFAAAAPTDQSSAIDKRAFNTCYFSNMGTKAGVTAAAKILAARTTGDVQIAEPVILASTVVNGQKTTISAKTSIDLGSPGFYVTTYQKLAEYALNIIGQCDFLQCVTLQGQPDCLVAGLFSPTEQPWLEIEVTGDYNGPVQVITTGPPQ